MRYQLAANDLDVNIYFPKIISRKHLVTRASLVAVQTNVIALCQAYAGVLKSLNTPKEQNWAPDAAAALKSCYMVATEELSKHKDSILKALKTHSEVNVLRCAYCMLNDPATWDHYMPKENFPEYSVYHENLVYICYGCNTRKSNYFDVDGLIYCHPYFTVDNEEAILHCKVAVEKGCLSIRYYGAGIGGFEQAGKIAHQHLLRLGLSGRFKGEASSTVSGLIRELQQYYPKGVSKEALDRILERRYSQSRKELGCNAWDSRLWHGLAACPEFLIYANEKIKEGGGGTIDGFRQTSPPVPI